MCIQGSSKKKLLLFNSHSCDIFSADALQIQQGSALYLLPLHLRDTLLKGVHPPVLSPLFNFSRLALHFFHEASLGFLKNDLPLPQSMMGSALHVRSVSHR